jgi:hypothetical protein
MNEKPRPALGIARVVMLDAGYGAGQCDERGRSELLLLH